MPAWFGIPPGYVWHDAIGWRYRAPEPRPVELFAVNTHRSTPMGIGERKMDRRVFLKIKIKTLAAESRFIRTTGDRLHGPEHGSTRNALAEHRRGTVRRAARNTLLAYGFLRGRTYREMEPRCDSEPNWTEVARMVAQYGVTMSDGETLREYRARCVDQELRLAQWRQGVGLPPPYVVAPGAPEPASIVS